MWNVPHEKTPKSSQQLTATYHVPKPPYGRFLQGHPKNWVATPSPPRSHPSCCQTDGMPRSMASTWEMCQMCHQRPIETQK